MTTRSRLRGACFGPLLVAPLVASAQGADTAARGPSLLGVQLLGAQVNVIAQHLAPFQRQYDGPNSLQATGDTKTSHAYGVYLGAHLWRGLDAYVDVEMIRGEGVGRVVGLAGPTNGDVIRQGSADLGDGPYVARAFLRYVHGFGAATERLERGIDQVPAAVASERLEITAGTFGVSDVFDVNRYANSTRLQFMNWSLFQNTSWDFAADTRGYSNGIAVGYVTPTWAIRAGAFQMPTRANGNVFDNDLRNANSFDAELTLVRPSSGTIVRTLVWLNRARMGNYAAAIVRGAATVTTPDIVADDQPGRTKYGIGVNIEQPIADGGETGAFLRAGWSDGRNESFAFTEVDRHLSVGLQLSGARWSRPGDRVGVAIVDHGISSDHRDYLAAGGSGFLLGDGRLSYGDEQIFEAYYRGQLGPYVQLGPDVQLIRNPGYNADRGPAAVVSLRLNLRY
jgi:high affinity Mn2+ porin